MIQKSHFWVYSQRKWKQDPGEVPILPYLLHLIHNSEDMETTQVSIKDEWMKKWWYIYIYIYFSCCSVAKSCPTLWPHGPQHIRPPCPSPSPEVCPSSCQLHRWCHPAISSSDTLFSLHPQSLPASGTFPMSWLFASDDHQITSP